MDHIDEYELYELERQELRRLKVKMLREESLRRIKHGHKWGSDAKCDACGISQKECFFRQRTAGVCPGAKS